MKSTVCLNMIVKDEAPVIRRCLESVRPLIDSWVILDTGSSDGTQDVIREVLGDLPGALHESPFNGFDASRSEAIDLAMARGDADYLLFIDADDLMEVEPGFRMQSLTHDAYRVALHDGPIIHWRPALVSTRLPWRYVGILHEYIECGKPYSLGTLTGANILSVGAGRACGRTASGRSTCAMPSSSSRGWSRSPTIPVTCSTSPRAGGTRASRRSRSRPMTGGRRWAASRRRSSARSCTPHGSR